MVTAPCVVADPGIDICILWFLVFGNSCTRGCTAGLSGVACLIRLRHSRQSARIICFKGLPVLMLGSCWLLLVAV